MIEKTLVCFLLCFICPVAQKKSITFYHTTIILLIARKVNLSVFVLPQYMLKKGTLYLGKRSSVILSCAKDPLHI